MVFGNEIIEIEIVAVKSKLKHLCCELTGSANVVIEHFLVDLFHSRPDCIHVNLKLLPRQKHGSLPPPTVIWV